MFVAVQSFGSIWTVRVPRPDAGASNDARRRAYYNSTGVLAGTMLRNRSRAYGYVRLDECSGFDPAFAQQAIHRVYETEGISVWNGRNKLFLRHLVPAGTRPDAHLFGIRSAEIGWIDSRGAWKSEAAQTISFSEGNGQQEVLVLLPPFGVTGRNFPPPSQQFLSD